MVDMAPGLADVVRAERLVRPHLFPTDARRMNVLSQRLGTEIFIKPENLQRTGSFKIRGAINRVVELAETGATAVATASAGNHGQGVAYAAHQYGMKATVVVPETASSVKVAALRRMGVELHLAGRSFDDAQRAMLKLAEASRMPVVSPYDAAVIAGQGTVGYEFIQEVPDLDVMLVPVGAGGLLAGCLAAAKQMNPRLQVIGVQAANSPSMVAALDAGRIIDVPIEPTLADGLEGNIEGGELPYSIIQRLVDDVRVVDEDAIATAMRMFAADEHMIVEGAGAVGLALLIDGSTSFTDKRVGLVVSGGNVSIETLRSVLGA